MIVDRALVSRIEWSFARDAAGLAISRAELEPGCGAEAVDCAGGRVIYMGPGMYVNRAMGVGVSEPARAADVDFIVDFYASHSLDAEIELCPTPTTFCVPAPVSWASGSTGSAMSTRSPFRGSTPAGSGRRVRAR